MEVAMGFFLRQLSVSRVRQRSQPARYDAERDELLVREGGKWIPGVESEEPPRTKKADLEKSDDQKDRWA
jgi:hypothetical protein